MYLLLASITTLYGRNYGLPFTLRRFLETFGKGNPISQWRPSQRILWNPSTKTGQMVAKLWVRTGKIRLTQPLADRLRTHKESRRRANRYWNKLCSEYQGVDNRCATKTTYKKVKVALRQQANKVAPIKSKSAESIYDKNKEVNCWREHWSELYSVERHFDGTIRPPTLSRSTELESGKAEQLMAFQVAKHLAKMSYQRNSSSWMKQASTY